MAVGHDPALAGSSDQRPALRDRQWSGRIRLVQHYSADGLRGPAIAVSAVVFGLYHLSPLNSWYSVYWHAPITQMVTATTGGLVLGYVFSRRGYETTVLGHALGNTVLFSLFTKGS